MQIHILEPGHPPRGDRISCNSYSLPQNLIPDPKIGKVYPCQRYPTESFCLRWMHRWYICILTKLNLSLNWLRLLHRLGICRCASPQRGRQLGKYSAVTQSANISSFYILLQFVFCFQLYFTVVRILLYFVCILLSRSWQTFSYSVFPWSLYFLFCCHIVGKTFSKSFCCLRWCTNALLTLSQM